MSAVVAGCLTERHLTLFGAIVQWFARHELLMQKIIATVIESDSAAVMLLTRDLTFGEKHRALLGLLHHRSVPTRSIRGRGEVALEFVQSLLPVNLRLPLRGEASMKRRRCSGLSRSSPSGSFPSVATLSLSVSGRRSFKSCCALRASPILVRLARW